MQDVGVPPVRFGMRRPPVLGLGAQTLIAALRKVFPWLVILAVPAVILLVVRGFSAYAWDFRAFYDAGPQSLHGRSPYGGSSLAELTSQRNFVYPLPAAALLAPLS